MGVSSRGRLRFFKISYIKTEKKKLIYRIFSRPRSQFLDEKEMDFPFDIFLPHVIMSGNFHSCSHHLVQP